MNRRFWRLGLGAGLGGALLLTAYLLINTTFMIYDDEGYLLLTYKNFLGGARLYDDIFSQYGPWPYLYHQLVTTVLQQPLTHALGRDLTALHWTLCALFCGALVARVTGRTVVWVCATLITFGLLWQMVAEPSHPGSLISAMLAIIVFTATATHETGRWTSLGASIGFGAALLLMTKVNVGLLFVAGAGVGALRLTAWPERWRRPAEILATLGLLAVPWGLMGKKLGEPWVLLLAVQFTAAAAGLLWVTPPALVGRPVPPRTWGVAAGVFAATLAALIAAICLQGTSLHALLLAVLINPLRMPANFIFGLTWVTATWPVTIACWLATAWAGWNLRRQAGVGRVASYTLIALRLGAMLVFVLNARTWLTIFGVGRFIVFCLPLLPVFLVPLAAAPAPANRRSSVLWAACLALPQVLHAFPVAGSQMGWGTFLCLAPMLIGLHDAGLFLVETLPPAGRWLPRAGWTLLLLVSLGQAGLMANRGWERYHSSRPLDLPGAEDVRLEGPARVAFRVLTMNAAVHADLLFSRPGMFSYNQWSGVPTPTFQNATHWFWLLDTPAQTRIIERLRDTPRTAIITNQLLDDFVEQNKVPTQSPLQTYIRAHYRPLFVLNSFRFLVPEASRAVPFGRVELNVLNNPRAADRETALVRTNIVLEGNPATIQLQSLDAPWPVIANYTKSGARVFLEPITAQGEVSGATIPLPVDHAVRGLFRLSILLAQVPQLTQPQHVALTVLAPDGTVLSESLF
ncbi:MAG: hypothetical protein JWQ83_1923 [Lacunisphaera sp.]|nr:hypothetical protein [Lacunisphaera sp.]